MFLDVETKPPAGERFQRLCVVVTRRAGSVSARRIRRLALVADKTSLMLLRVTAGKSFGIVLDGRAFVVSLNEAFCLCVGTMCRLKLSRRRGIQPEQVMVRGTWLTQLLG